MPQVVRALHVFTVGWRRTSLIVRVMPTIRDVDAAYRAGKRRQPGKWVHAYFEPAPAAAGHTGCIVLAADGNPREHVPHEVFHAVKHALGDIDTDTEERAATTIGKLCDRIFAELHAFWLEV